MLHNKTLFVYQTMPSQNNPMRLNPTRTRAQSPHNGDRPGTPPGRRRDAERDTPHHPTPGPENNPRTEHPKKGKRANVILASLNINGARAPTANANFMDKWSLINRTMRSNKIAILAIQETHLDNDHADSIWNCFGNCFKLLCSSDPERPRSKAGVAFLINKALLPTNITKLHILVPGRAIMIKLKWPDTENLTIINIYAPVRKERQPNFWAQVETIRREKHLSRPDFLLGDFNIVEDAIDRAPARHDDRIATDTLRDIRLTWEIQDQWRHAHPNTNLYTYRYQKHRETRLSRLDRIYSARKHAQAIFEWKAEPSAVPTDHWLISLKFAPKDAPLIGNGRWTLYLPDIEDGHLIEKIASKGVELEKKLDLLEREPTNRAVSNPQTLWETFKNDVKMTVKKETDKSKYKAMQKIKNLEKDRSETIETLAFERNEPARTHEAYLANEIKHLMRKDAQGKREDMKANLIHHGEKLGGIWTAISKGKKPRDLIRRLKIPNQDPPQYERSTVRMANLARNYHAQLQDDATRVPEEERSEHIRAALTVVPDAQLMEEPDRSPLDQLITEAAVERALKTAKNCTATGMDGCPYELWKKLDEKYSSDRLSGNEGFNIIKTLTRVFRDIQTHDVDKNTNFTLGWMCPIYKKKDPTEICNYRPITLLDTDYKLLTKALATQLMDDIERLIHTDQAGFIPKRSIFNQIRLAQTIIEYTEATNEDGAIVALDQEKAYNKIKHDYLWATLNKFNLPQTFIKTVKALYQNAHTQVAINGILSRPFQVTRGVRQGDPLSCALFDIAIEPLACQFRSNPNLKGIKIPGMEEKLITSLFADDTNLFLNKNDRMDDVQHILDEWCKASGAKFNLEKSEIVPLGTVDHRTRVAETRKINPRDALPLDERIRIASDGSAIRSLGAWIGNKTNAETPWEPIIDKTHNALNGWSKLRPTLRGRKLIVQMVFGGYTQFLTKAQGMPQKIEETLTKMVRDFMWEESTNPKIALETLHRPPEVGGLNLLDIKARNDAIEITWLKTYLDLSLRRPAWAKLADILIDAVAPPHTNPRARINTFLQSWNPPIRGARATQLKGNITRMLNVARKYGLTFTAIRLAPHLKLQLPAWYHTHADHRPASGRTASCLIKTHHAKTVADLLNISNRIRNEAHPYPHIPSAWCLCRECVRDCVNQCKDPHACAKEALERIQTIYPVMNPLHADIPTLCCLCDRAAKGGDQIVLEVWVSAGLSERSEQCLANRSVGPKWPDTVRNKFGLL